MVCFPRLILAGWLQHRLVEQVIRLRMRIEPRTIEGSLHNYLSNCVLMPSARVLPVGWEPFLAWRYAGWNCSHSLDMRGSKQQVRVVLDLRGREARK
jgi:hypothetical protein